MPKKIAFLFPGQGAQYVKMGKDFADHFAVAKHTFEEADDILNRNLSRIIFEGPENELTATKNSQTAIFVVSIALLRTLQSLFPQLKPSFVAGLSLGEYTALHASGRIGFKEALKLVQFRGQCMNDACEATAGTMAVILGLNAEAVEKLVREVNLPQDLWAANFNCPGQVVISGTVKGIQAGTEAALAHGAKRVLPLQVHGAFHSGLMQSAKEKLSRYFENVVLQESQLSLIMNVTAKPAAQEKEIKELLIQQVVSPVRWEQSVRYMLQEGADLLLEIGCGKTLSGFNKRIEGSVAAYNVEKIIDLENVKLIER